MEPLAAGECGIQLPGPRAGGISLTEPVLGRDFGPTRGPSSACRAGVAVAVPHSGAHYPGPTCKTTFVWRKQPGSTITTDRRSSVTGSVVFARRHQQHGD